MVDVPMFVLQRRIDQTSVAVRHALLDSNARGSTRRDLAGGVYAQIDGALDAAPPLRTLGGASWRAPATIRNRHGRVIERIELEVNAWDASRAELLVRPRTRHPQRWSRRRRARYFRLAHPAADLFAQLVTGADAPSPFRGSLDRSTAAESLPLDAQRSSRSINAGSRKRRAGTPVGAR